MKMKCPACGTPIPSEHINVQTMTAVCPECDNVFTFKAGQFTPDRKTKPPKQITFYDDVPMHFSFKWDWRTEPIMALIGIFGVLIFSVTFLVQTGLGILAAIIALPMLYILTALVVNNTHFKIEGGYLHVYTQPLWYPYYGRYKIRLCDIEHISIKKMIDTPSATQVESYYNMYAHTVDGRDIMLARLLNSQHAHFIAQEIESALDSEDDTIRHRLEDDDLSEDEHYDELEAAVISNRQ